MRYRMRTDRVHLSTTWAGRIGLQHTWKVVYTLRIQQRPCIICFLVSFVSLYHCIQCISFQDDDWSMYIALFGQNLSFDGIFFYQFYPNQLIKIEHRSSPLGSDDGVRVHSDIVYLHDMSSVRVTIHEDSVPNALWMWKPLLSTLAIPELGLSVQKVKWSFQCLATSAPTEK